MEDNLEQTVKKLDGARHHPGFYFSITPIKYPSYKFWISFPQSRSRDAKISIFSAGNLPDLDPDEIVSPAILGGSGS